MIVSDELYGPVVIPEWLVPVLHSPEVQRLREVRLINTSSPSFPGLSDVHRYTHTIGVYYLASHLYKKICSDWPKEDLRAFLVAALLHDIGTPPFGHVFEYLLNATRGWNHEKFVDRIIRGTYRPEKRYHQIYYSNSLGLYRILADIKVDVDLIVGFILGKDALGKVLAGTIDIDNIDTVYRMATLLGFHPNTSESVNLVENLIPEQGGLKFKNAAVPILESWRLLRQRTYQILCFDHSCVSGEAMLTDCLTKALQKNILGEEHWFFTDEQLLRFLLSYPDTKEIVQRFVIGDFYKRIFLGWYSCAKGNKDLRDPKYRTELGECLTNSTKILCCPYIFYDSGTFSKELTINVHSTNSITLMTLGRKSESTIVSVFTPNRIKIIKNWKLQEKIVEVLDKFGLPSSHLIKIPDRGNLYGISGQEKLSI
jgi:hypothetical protein